MHYIHTEVSVRYPIPISTLKPEKCLDTKILNILFSNKSM